MECDEERVIGDRPVRERDTISVKEKRSRISRIPTGQSELEEMLGVYHSFYFFFHFLFSVTSRKKKPWNRCTGSGALNTVSVQDGSSDNTKAPHSSTTNNNDPTSQKFL